MREILKLLKKTLLNILKKIIALISSFIKKCKNGNSSKPRTHSATECTAAKWYTTTTELPLNKFINCLCDDDLLMLVISGDPNPHDLQKAWFYIYEEFLDGMADKEGVHKIRLHSKIVKCKFDYELIQLCIECLSKAYVRSIAEKLKTLVRCGELNPEDMNSYFNDLRVAKTRSNKLLQQIEEKQAELKVLESRESTGEKVSKKHFDSLIASVSIYTKFHIDKKNVSVSEFVEYYSSMRDQSEAIQKEMNKR